MSIIILTFVTDINEESGNSDQMKNLPFTGCWGRTATIFIPTYLFPSCQMPAQPQKTGRWYKTSNAYFISHFVSGSYFRPSWGHSFLIFLQISWCTFGSCKTKWVMIHNNCVWQGKYIAFLLGGWTANLENDRSKAYPEKLHLCSETV